MTEGSWTTCVDYQSTTIYLKLKCPICGDRSGFGGSGAVYIQCPSCRTVFELPTDLPLVVTNLDPLTTDGILPADTEQDEE